MASESQTTVSPSCRQGTRPVGENVLLPGLGSPVPESETMRSVNGAPESFIARKPRSDHDE